MGIQNLTCLQPLAIQRDEPRYIQQMDIKFRHHRQKTPHHSIITKMEVNESSKQRLKSDFF